MGFFATGTHPIAVARTNGSHEATAAMMKSGHGRDPGNVQRRDVTDDVIRCKSLNCLDSLNYCKLMVLTLAPRRLLVNGDRLRRLLLLLMMMLLMMVVVLPLTDRRSVQPQLQNQRDQVYTIVSRSNAGHVWSGHNYHQK